MEEVFKTISKIVGSQPTWVVGGYVRDLILNRPNKDIDVVTIGSGVELAERFAKAYGVEAKVFRGFGTGQVTTPSGIEVEFVGARRESYDRHSRNPIVEDGTFEDDWKRRDFRCNDLYLCLNEGPEYGQILDPTGGGIDDIKEKFLVTPVDPDRTFFDDPLRMLRAIRFSCTLGFSIGPIAYASIVKNAERISIVSPERITDEFQKIMKSSEPWHGISQLQNTGLLRLIIPELSALDFNGGVGQKHHKNVFLHSLGVLENITPKTDNLWLRWAALLHDIGKPQVQKWNEETYTWEYYDHEHIGASMVPDIFRRLGLPLGTEMKYVQLLVKLHMRPGLLDKNSVTDSGVRRLIHDAEGYIDDLLLLAECDVTSGRQHVRDRIAEEMITLRNLVSNIVAKDADRLFKPVIGGNQIMEYYQIPPSDLIGTIKADMKEQILDGVLDNTEEALMKWLEINKKKYVWEH